MQYAQQLQTLVDAGELLGYAEQPQVFLFGKLRFRPDFIVVPASGPTYYVDVKGAETGEFKQILKLWPASQKIKLHVVKKKGQRFETTGVY